MEGQNDQGSLQLTAFASSGKPNNASLLVDEDDSNRHDIMSTCSNEMHHVPLGFPQWMYCPQTHQNYVEFLAERGFTEIQKETPYSVSIKASCPRSTDLSPMPEEYQSHRNEVELLKFTGTENQLHVQKQDLNGVDRNDSQPFSRLPTSGPNRKSRAHHEMSRQRTYSVDRHRRLRIAARLQALQDLLPHPNEGSRASVLDDIIDRVKYLQFQVKDLSRRRLGRESISTPLIFLEGYGHFIFHEQMLNGPLEETIGKLLEVNPSSASAMLQSRGLFIMPMDLAEEMQST